MRIRKNKMNLEDFMAAIGKEQLDGGEITLEPSITAGQITISGIGTIVDNATSYTSLNIDSLLSGDKLDDLYKLQGLDIDNPMTVTPSSRNAGSISQIISGDGTSSTTVTRV